MYILKNKNYKTYKKYILKNKQKKSKNIKK